MTFRDTIVSLGKQEDLNFLFTNRIPRIAVTRLVGRLSHVRHPLIRVPSIALLRLFTNPALDEAAQTEFETLHDCFTRSLKAGARPIHADPGIVVSPCDAIVGATGAVVDGQVIQCKGFRYALGELLVDPKLTERFQDGRFITLRLTAGMYHRFHAPHDCSIHHVTYVSGDTWNTNPIALKRVEKLFCKNEHVILRTTLDEGRHEIAMVAVASVLVASIRLHFLDVLLHLRHKGPNEIPCHTRFQKGQEVGWFELGSTILLFAPKEFSLAEGVLEGRTLRMGQPLFRLPP